MKPSARGIALFLFALLLSLAARAEASRQIVALFPPDVDPAAADNVLAPAVPILEGTMTEHLGKRFDVRSAASLPPSADAADPKRRKARALGASHVVTGTLSRIGKGVTLDVTLAPVEDAGKGRTVVVSGVLAEASPASQGYAALFSRLGGEAAKKVIEVFFGAERTPSGGARPVPAPGGMIHRSAPLPGEVVSAAMSDLDRDGRMEVAAAFPSEIVIYAQDGSDLKEEMRIADAGPGLFHIEARDVDRDGLAEIAAVRFVGRKAVSDIWRFDGNGYRRVSSGHPYFLRIADLGPEGIVLLGQEADPSGIYRGPVLRMALRQDGSLEAGRALPLPEGTFLYGFVPVRYGKEMRYVVLSARDRLVYLDAAGKELWEGIDAFSGTEVVLGGMTEKIDFPARMVALDWNRDGNDELILLNALVSAGTFFENLRVATQAELVCFIQEADSLQLAWRSPGTDSSAQELILDASRPGAPRFGLASQDRRKILGGAAQWRVLWMR